MKTVRITVECGMVQQVEVPEGVTVVVRDYDVDGCNPAFLRRDENGDSYVEIIWGHED